MRSFLRFHHVLFSAWALGLLATESQAAEAYLVKDINVTTHPFSSDPQLFSVFGNKLIFRASDRDHGQELWVTDGTFEGTMLLKDIAPGPDSSGPGDFTPIGDRFIFSASDLEHGRELWVSNGTPEGTALLKDIAPGPDSSSPFGLRSLGNRLVFVASDHLHFPQLWITDGTADGTILLKDIALDSRFIDFTPLGIGLSFELRTSRTALSSG